MIKNPSRPSSHLEVSLFGPRYGESALIHLPDNKWIIVDSCGDEDDPAALKYLRAIGADPAENVHLIVCTHWHADHVSGIAALLDECKRANFATTAALSRDEFISSMKIYDEDALKSEKHPAREFVRIIDILTERDTTWIRAMDGRSLEDQTPIEANITVLYPSDEALRQADRIFADTMPEVGETRRRPKRTDPNHSSVVLHIDLGIRSILLGGDLKRTNYDTTGWTFIVDKYSDVLPNSSTFKIPHHGDIDAQHPEMWNDMLLSEPFAALTPHNRNPVKHPTPDEVEFIIQQTETAYSTAQLHDWEVQDRPRSVQNKIENVTEEISLIDPEMGQVRFRHEEEGWKVTLDSNAVRLEDIEPS